MSLKMGFFQALVLVLPEEMTVSWWIIHLSVEFKKGFAQKN